MDHTPGSQDDYNSMDSDDDDDHHHDDEDQNDKDVSYSPRFLPRFPQGSVKNFVPTPASKEERGV